MHKIRVRISFSDATGGTYYFTDSPVIFDSEEEACWMPRQDKEMFIQSIYPAIASEPMALKHTLISMYKEYIDRLKDGLRFKGELFDLSEELDDLYAQLLEVDAPEEERKMEST